MSNISAPLRHLNESPKAWKQLGAESKRKHLLSEKQAFLTAGCSGMPVELLHPLMGRLCFLPKERLIHEKISKKASGLLLNLMLTLIVFIFYYSICECDWLWSHNNESALFLQNKDQLKAKKNLLKISRIVMFKYSFIQKYHNCKKNKKNKTTIYISFHLIYLL